MRDSPPERLRDGLARVGLPDLIDGDIAFLPDKGLAHDHLRLGESGLLARVPKQSQMRLAAEENLSYQAACFQRAAAGGHTPRLHWVIPPSDSLPRGALIVEEIAGRTARLPEDLPAIAAALAAIHRLPLPAPEARPPLLNPGRSLDGLLHEVRDQGAYLAQAELAPEAEAAIRAEIAAFETAAAEGLEPPRALISFDAHPGNFLIRPDGGAVLVDLEKARYGPPPLDLAHATLFTSTTWDVASYAELTAAEVADFYAVWLVAVGPLGGALRPWLLPLRRGMWLWSVTWCAKWRVTSRAAAKDAGDGEDWSAEKSEDALIRHVAGRVAAYLAPQGVARVREEFETLGDCWR